MFSVVRFSKDNTTSEVPSSWIDKNGKGCWWPLKNPGSLIQKKTPPGAKGTSWKQFDVEVLNKDLPYEDARLKAGKDDSTSDDDFRGRGMRKIFPRTCVDSDSDSEFVSELSTLPKLRSNIKQVFNKGMMSNERIVEVPEKVFEVDLANIHTIPIIISDEALPIEGDVLEEDDLDSLSRGFMQLNEGSEGNEKEKSVSEFSVQSKHSKITTNEESILRMFGKIQYTLTCIEKRLENIEKQKNVQDSENESIVIDFVPFPFEQLDEINSMLTINNQVASSFKKFIHQVGGNNPKDNIYKILQRLFSNECALKCSWKGYKNNYAVYKLEAIKHLKEQILKTYSHMTESEVDNIGAEWFRFARQRFNREMKRNEK